MISLSELQALIQVKIAESLADTTRGSTSVALDNSLGRVLAVDIIANINLPPQDVSAMDGYAVYVDDETTKEIIGESIAGQVFTGKVKAQQCVRIMTGAVVPVDCQAVIMQENVTLHDNGTITINKPVKLGQNIRRKGEEISSGQHIFSKGQLISTAVLMVLASLGFAQVAVYPNLKVAVISSGDELNEVGTVINQLGQIYDSNRHMIMAKLSLLPIEIIDYQIVEDNLAKITEVLQLASNEADIVITSGGVSVGDYDFLKEALSQIGVIHQFKVAMKPGKPFVFGQINHAWYFGLPGNPVAGCVGMDLIVKSALWQLSGRTAYSPLIVPAKLAQDITKSALRLDVQRMVLSHNEQGELQISPVGKQDSHRVLGVAQANAYALLPKGKDFLPAGTIVQVLPFVEEFI